MELNRLTQGEKIAGVAALLLFISMFFAWFGFDTGLGDLENQFGLESTGPDSVTFNAWESFDFIDLVLLITAIAGVGTALARASDLDVDFPLSTVVAVLGGLATLLVLYRILDTPGDADREWGVFVGLILSALVAYGGYRAMQEEGLTFGDAADRFGGPGGGPGAGSGVPRDSSPGPGTGSAEAGTGTPPPPPPSSPPPPPPSSGV